MNILFIGDIYGKLGRSTVAQNLTKIKNEYNINFVIANGENAAHGRGITEAIYKEFLSLGIQVITMGNHTFDNRDIFNFINEARNLLRPANMDISVPGKGYEIFTYNEIKIVVINLIGRTYLPPLDSPFRKFDEIYNEVKDLKPIIIVDFHAEATSEKIAFGYYVDGRATAVIGTHTHVPTNDYRLLPKQTAYITDVGMCGPLNGVIGVEKDSVINRFINGLPTIFSPVEEGDVQFNAVVIKVDLKTKKALEIKSINLKD